MISKIDNVTRSVVPAWRDFDRTVNLGELTIPSKGGGVKLETSPVLLSELEEEWRKNNSLHHATDLFSALVTNSIFDSNLFEDVSSFILKHPRSNVFQKDFVSQVIDNSESDHKKMILEYDDLVEYLELFEKDGIFKKIRILKSRIADYPRNSIFYIELARYYTLISQFNKAEKYISLALKLDRSNRYVVRSAVRFYVLIGEIDKARFFLRRSRLVNYDPWLLAGEISVSELMGKTSSHIKKGFELSSSNKFREYDLTELRSSLASVELFKGKTKNSKKLFRKSLVEPNDNSMAQVEWASNKYNLFLVDPESYNVDNNFEALFYDSVEQSNWQKAFKNALRWYLDTPYVLEPVVRGAQIAGLYLNDCEKAENLTKYGLYNNPNDPMLLNNLAYYLAKNSKLEESKKILKKVESINPADIKITTLLCLDATRGLIEIKDENIQVGIRFYEKAIFAANLIENDYLAKLGELEMALALPRNNERRSTIIEKYNQFPDGLGASDLSEIFKRIKNNN